MLVLFVWLFLLIFGLAVSPLAPSSTAHTGTAIVVPVRRVPFAVNGRTVAPGKPIRLHQGDLLRFSTGVSTLSVIRIECVSDSHRVPLTHKTWRVPDLPTGEYELAVQGGRASAEVSVVSHEAPCPSP